MFLLFGVAVLSLTDFFSKNLMSKDFFSDYYKN